MSVWRKNAKIWFDECRDILTELRNLCAAEEKKALMNEAVGRLTCLHLLTMALNSGCKVCIHLPCFYSKWVATNKDCLLSRIPC